MHQFPVHKLLGLPAETQSGVALGRVHEILVDVPVHTITHYEVRKGIVPGRHTYFLIHTSQVISITDEKMVVHDEVANQELHEHVNKEHPLGVPEGVATSHHT